MMSYFACTSFQVATNNPFTGKLTMAGPDLADATLVLDARCHSDAAFDRCRRIPFSDSWQPESCVATMSREVHRMSLWNIVSYYSRPHEPLTAEQRERIMAILRRR